METEQEKTLRYLRREPYERIKSYFKTRLMILWAPVERQQKVIQKVETELWSVGWTLSEFEEEERLEYEMVYRTLSGTQNDTN